MKPKLNQKGAANLIATMAYLLISFAIIAMVTVSAMDLLSSSKEQANYETMLDSFEKINLALKDSIVNKQEIDLKIINPEELEIDCTNDKIKGKIKYTGEYRTDETIISDILTYKQGDFIYFEKDITNLGNIILDCKDKLLPNGKVILTINYFDYNSDTKTISLDISHNTKDYNVSWYNSNWAYRTKITIDHTKVEEDLTNFPLLLKINPITDPETLTEEQIQATLNLAYAKSDGTGLVFTTNDGKTKLKREIESITSEGVLPYYIEENGTERYVWTKLNLGPNETKQIVINKTLDDSPNGDDVFDFYDDFHGDSINENKWLLSSTYYSFTGTSLKLRKGAITLANPLSFNLANNYIVKIRAKQLQSTGLYGGVLPSVCSSNYYISNNGTSQALIAPQKQTGTVSTIYLFAGSGSAASYNIASGTLITTFNNNEYNVFETIIKQNQFDINKNNTNIYASSTVTFTKELKYLTLGYGAGTDTYDISDTEYDYLFVRKYTTTEPTITTTEIGDQFVVTITNNLSETLTDYQIKIPAEDIEVYSKYRSLEIIDQSFSPNNNELAAWVKIPTLSSSNDTIIYMYYGNPNANEENDSDVWPSDYVLVQHLNENSGDNGIEFLDSTANANNGIAKGFDDINSTTDAIGKIARASEHTIIPDLLDNNYPSENTSNFIDFGTIYNNDWNYQTVSIWVNWTGQTYGGYSLIYGDNRYSNFGRFLIATNGSILVQNQASGNLFTTNPLPSNEWVNIVYKYNSDESKEYIYVNGEKEEQERTQNISFNAYPLKLGFADSYAFSGKIDEFRVSNIARTDSWIKTEYNNQNDPYSFYTFGVKENQ